jgi:hypothetical protein
LIWPYAAVRPQLSPDGNPSVVTGMTRLRCPFVKGQFMGAISLEQLWFALSLDTGRRIRVPARISFVRAPIR